MEMYPAGGRVRFVQRLPSFGHGCVPSGSLSSAYATGPLLRSITRTYPVAWWSAMESTLLVRGRGHGPPSALFAVAPMLRRVAQVGSHAAVEFEPFDGVEPVAVVAAKLDRRDHAAAREAVDVRRLDLPALGELLG